MNPTLSGRRASGTGTEFIGIATVRIKFTFELIHILPDTPLPFFYLDVDIAKHTELLDAAGNRSR